MIKLHAITYQNISLNWEKYRLAIILKDKILYFSPEDNPLFQQLMDSSICPNILQLNDYWYTWLLYGRGQKKLM